MPRSVIAFALMGLLIGVTACRADNPETPRLPETAQAPPGLAMATIAGGCFWCMEAPFDALPGVHSTTSGYIDGFVDQPTYRAVANGTTGHTEAVRIIYDPKLISFEKLLRVFWMNIDPTVKNRQFCDRGTQYRSGIYYHSEAQKKAAEASLSWVKANIKVQGTIHTELKAATRFYPAEAYHQDYYRKNPVHYKRYRQGCGRDARLQVLWGAKKAH